MELVYDFYRDSLDNILDCNIDDIVASTNNINHLLLTLIYFPVIRAF